MSVVFSVIIDNNKQLAVYKYEELYVRGANIEKR